MVVLFGVIIALISFGFGLVIFRAVDLKVLPRVAMKTNKNRSQVNTRLFRLSLDLPHENEDTPVVRNDGKNIMLLFCYLANCIVEKRATVSVS